MHWHLGSSVKTQSSKKVGKRTLCIDEDVVQIYKEDLKE
jgi:hypothetical protein